MSEAALAQLLPTLKAIADKNVRKPNMPVSVALMEGNAILVTLRNNPAVLDRIVAAGPDLDAPAEDLELSLGALRQSQAIRISAGSNRTPEELLDLEARGYALRADLVAACRWNFRRKKELLKIIAGIVEGEGRADLILDCDALALVIEDNAELFAKDDSFDVQAQAEGARAMAADLRAAMGAKEASADNDAVLEQRNRAWTHYRRVLAELRGAARYRFRNEPDLLHHFTSDYSRRANRKRNTRKARKKGAPTDA